MCVGCEMERSEGTIDGGLVWLAGKRPQDLWCYFWMLRGMYRKMVRLFGLTATAAGRTCGAEVMGRFCPGRMDWMGLVGVFRGRRASDNERERDGER